MIYHAGPSLFLAVSVHARVCVLRVFLLYAQERARDALGSGEGVSCIAARVLSNESAECVRNVEPTPHAQSQVNKCSNNLWSLRESSLLELAQQVELVPPSRAILSQAPKIVEVCEHGYTVSVCRIRIRGNTAAVAHACVSCIVVTRHGGMCVHGPADMLSRTRARARACSRACTLPGGSRTGVRRTLQGAASGAAAAHSTSLPPERVSLPASGYGSPAGTPAPGRFDDAACSIAALKARVIA